MDSGHTYYPLCSIPIPHTVPPVRQPLNDINPAALPEETEDLYLEHVQLIVEAPDSRRREDLQKLWSINGPSLFSVLKSLGALHCHPMDIMHWVGLNLPDIFFSLL